MSRGYFGIGIYHGKTSNNLGTLFRSALNLGADFIFTIGKRYTYQCSDTPKAFRNIPLYHYKDYDDFYSHIPMDCRLVGVELNDDARDLKHYIHPERAVYLLGAEDHGLPPSILNRCKDVVMIDSAGCMNVSVAGAIIMYDRKIKD